MRNKHLGEEKYGDMFKDVGKRGDLYGKTFRSE
jgi:hypothetical protein